MKVTIGCSSNDNIDDVYKKNSKEIIDYLANQNCDLNWGCASTSIMGICYREFLKGKREIYGFTTSKYASDINNLKGASSVVCDSTFDLKKNLFDTDLIVMLPGGTGTISEFFTFLEEIRSNDKNVPLIVYNKDRHYDLALSLIDDLIDRKFNSQDIYNYFEVVNSFDEFKKIFENIKLNCIV